MNYFTNEWWFVICQDFDRHQEADKAFADYETYLESVSGYLKEVPAILLDPCGLHDARIESIRLVEQTVEIDLIESTIGNSQKIRITGVQSFTKKAIDDSGSSFEHESVGYHEIIINEQKETITLAMICDSMDEIYIGSTIRSMRFELINFIKTKHEAPE